MNKGHFFFSAMLEWTFVWSNRKNKNIHMTWREKEKSQLNNQLNDFIRHHILRKNRIKFCFFYSL